MKRVCSLLPGPILQSDDGFKLHVSNLFELTLTNEKHSTQIPLFAWIDSNNSVAPFIMLVGIAPIVSKSGETLEEKEWLEFCDVLKELFKQTKYEVKPFFYWPGECGIYPRGDLPQFLQVWEPAKAMRALPSANFIRETIAKGALTFEELEESWSYCWQKFVAHNATVLSHEEFEKMASAYKQTRK